MSPAVVFRTSARSCLVLFIHPVCIWSLDDIIYAELEFLDISQENWNFTIPIKGRLLSDATHPQSTLSHFRSSSSPVESLLGPDIRGPFDGNSCTCEVRQNYPAITIYGLSSFVFHGMERISSPSFTSRVSKASHFAPGPLDLSISLR